MSEISARRIAWGKLLNSGQTCVAPDYLLLHEDIYKSFITAYIKETQNMYGTDATLNKEYCKIISKKTAFLNKSTKLDINLRYAPFNRKRK